MRNLERLRRVLSVKQRIRDHANGAMARARHALTDAEKRAQEAQAVSEAMTAKLASNRWTGEELAVQAELVGRAAREGQIAHDRRIEHQHMLERRVADAAEAERRVRTLEKIEERLVEEDTLERRRGEQKAADEVAGRRRR